MIVAITAYIHAMSLAMWFGGLFVYLVIVWPALTRSDPNGFPRTTLASIGVGTAPWILLAMFCAAASLLGYWIAARPGFEPWVLGTYAMVLSGLIVNNLYGAAVAWPRIMLLPEVPARHSWRAFRARMMVSLVFGLSALSAWVIMS